MPLPVNKYYLIGGIVGFIVVIIVIIRILFFYSEGEKVRVKVSLPGGMGLEVERESVEKPPEKIAEEGSVRVVEKKEELKELIGKEESAPIEKGPPPPPPNYMKIFKEDNR